MRTLEEINEVFPEHSRSSCSDDNLSNVGISDSGNLWCPRCQCLHELKLTEELEMMKRNIRLLGE